MNENFENSFYLPVLAPSPDTEDTTKHEATSVLAPGDEPLISNDESIAITETQIEYKPINCHWFYTSNVLSKTVWLPMSYKDSNSLEVEYKKYT